MTSKLKNQYSGEGANNYDAIRSQTKRWQNEQRAITELLQEIEPVRFVDVPVGTGRWIDLLEKADRQAIGIDISPDMIKQTREKLRAAGIPDSQFHLIEGSALDTASLVSDFAPDTIVCIRFVNWTDQQTLKRLLGVFNETRARHIVIGVSVIDTGTSIMEKLMMRFALLLERIRKFRQARQYVHDEAEVLAFCDRLAWTLVKKVPIFSNASRRNYIYHFETSRRSL